MSFGDRHSRCSHELPTELKTVNTLTDLLLRNERLSNFF